MELAVPLLAAGCCTGLTGCQYTGENVPEIDPDLPVCVEAHGYTDGLSPVGECLLQFEFLVSH